MKIALNVGSNDPGSPKAAQSRVLEREILAAKDGDWNAKHNLVRTFLPLLTSLAEKRTGEVAQLNRYIEAGKEGLYAAAKKYKPAGGAENFQIFALDFIEDCMNRCDKGKQGFFGRLFGKK